MPGIFGELAAVMGAPSVRDEHDAALASDAATVAPPPESEGTDEQAEARQQSASDLAGLGPALSPRQRGRAAAGLPLERGLAEPHDLETNPEKYGYAGGKSPLEQSEGRAAEAEGRAAPIRKEKADKLAAGVAAMRDRRARAKGDPSDPLRPSRDLAAASAGPGLLERGSQGLKEGAEGAARLVSLPFENTENMLSSYMESAEDKLGLPPEFSKLHEIPHLVNQVASSPFPLVSQAIDKGKAAVPGLFDPNTSFGRTASNVADAAKIFGGALLAHGVMGKSGEMVESAKATGRKVGGLFGDEPRPARYGPLEPGDVLEPQNHETSAARELADALEAHDRAPTDRTAARLDNARADLENAQAQTPVARAAVPGLEPAARTEATPSAPSQEQLARAYENAQDEKIDEGAAGLADELARRRELAPEPAKVRPPGQEAADAAEAMREARARAVRTQGPPRPTAPQALPTPPTEAPAPPAPPAGTHGTVGGLPLFGPEPLAPADAARMIEARKPGAGLFDPTAPRPGKLVLAPGMEAAMRDEAAAKAGAIGGPALEDAIRREAGGDARAPVEVPLTNVRERINSPGEGARRAFEQVRPPPMPPAEPRRVRVLGEGEGEGEALVPEPPKPAPAPPQEPPAPAPPRPVAPWERPEPPGPREPFLSFKAADYIGEEALRNEIAKAKVRERLPDKTAGLSPDEIHTLRVLGWTKEQVLEAPEKARIIANGGDEVVRFGKEEPPAPPPAKAASPGPKPPRFREKRAAKAPASEALTDQDLVIRKNRAATPEEAAAAQAELDRRLEAYKERLWNERAAPTKVAKTVPPQITPTSIETPKAALLEPAAKVERAPLLAPKEAPAPARAAATHWLDGLGEKREAALAAMREVHAEADRAGKNEAALKPRGGQVAAGAAGFDEFIRSDSLNNFLSEINKGKTPEAAAESAKAAARGSIERHNGQRKDMNWKRWEGTADAKIDWAKRQVADAIAPEEAPRVDEAAEPTLTDAQKRANLAAYQAQGVFGAKRAREGLGEAPPEPKAARKPRLSTDQAEAATGVRADANAQTSPPPTGPAFSAFSKEARQKATGILRAAADEAVAREARSGEMNKAKARMAEIDQALDSAKGQRDYATKRKVATLKAERTTLEEAVEKQSGKLTGKPVEVDLGDEGKFRVVNSPKAIATALSRFEKPGERPAGVVGAGPLMTFTPGTPLRRAFDFFRERGGPLVSGIMDTLTADRKLDAYEGFQKGTTIKDELRLVDRGPGSYGAQALADQKYASYPLKKLPAAEQALYKEALVLEDEHRRASEGQAQESGTPAQIAAKLQTITSNPRFKASVLDDVRRRYQENSQRYWDMAHEATPRYIHGSNLMAPTPEMPKHAYVPHHVLDFQEGGSVGGDGRAVRDFSPSQLNQAKGSVLGIERDPFRAQMAQGEATMRGRDKNTFNQNLAARHSLAQHVRQGGLASVDPSDIGLYSMKSGRAVLNEGEIRQILRDAINTEKGAPATPGAKTRRPMPPPSQDAPFAGEWHPFERRLVEGLAEHGEKMPSTLQPILNVAHAAGSAARGMLWTHNPYTQMEHVTGDPLLASVSVPFHRIPNLAANVVRNIAEATKGLAAEQRGERSPFLEQMRKDRFFGGVFKAMEEPKEIAKAEGGRHELSEGELPLWLQSKGSQATTVGKAVLKSLPEQLEFRQAMLRKAIADVWEQKEGASHGAAVNHAHRMMVDFGDQSPIERFFGPFASFTKTPIEMFKNYTTRLMKNPVTGKNLDPKMLLKGALPATAAMWALRYAINHRDKETSDFTENELPQQYEDKMALVGGKNADGTRHVYQSYSPLPMPLGLAKAFGDLVHGKPGAVGDRVGSGVLGHLQAPLRGLLEYKSGHDMLTGAPTTPEDQKAWTHVEKVAYNQKRGGLPVEPATQRLIDSVAGNFSTLAKQLMSTEPPDSADWWRAHTGAPVHVVRPGDRAMQELAQGYDDHVAQFRDALGQTGPEADRRTSALIDWFNAYGVSEKKLSADLKRAERSATLEQAMTPREQKDLKRAKKGFGAPLVAPSGGAKAPLF